MIIKTKLICLHTLDRARPKNVESAKNIIEIKLLLIYDRSILQLILCKLLHIHLLLVWKIAYSSILLLANADVAYIVFCLFVYSEVLVYNKYKAKCTRIYFKLPSRVNIIHPFQCKSLNWGDSWE